MGSNKRITITGGLGYYVGERAIGSNCTLFRGQIGSRLG